MKQAGPLGVDDFYRERGRLSGPKEFSDDLQAIERGPLPLGALSQYASLGHCCRQPPERPRRARHKLAEATTIVQRPPPRGSPSESRSKAWSTGTSRTRSRLSVLLFEGRSSNRSSGEERALHSSLSKLVASPSRRDECAAGTG
jgi:hypothetical protein